MDDPLKPRAVPLAAETVLWFEFLLDPNLLLKHLSTRKTDPSPSELICLLLSKQDTGPPPTALEPETKIDLTGSPPPNPEPEPIQCGREISQKQLTIRILALKVATWLKWDLDLLEQNLPLIILLQLIRDLLAISLGRFVHVPLQPNEDLEPGPGGNANALLFALTIYHRIVLRLQLKKDNYTRIYRPCFPNAPQPMDLFMEFFNLPTHCSVNYLLAMCQTTAPYHILTFNSLASHPTNYERFQHSFDRMQPIPMAEVRAQIHFDVASYCLHVEQYQTARDTALSCVASYHEARREYELSGNGTAVFLYCHIDEAMLLGLQAACGVSDAPTTLLEQFNQSALTAYGDIVNILHVDNVSQQIPLADRRVAELDIEALVAAQQPATLLTRAHEMQIAALNLVNGIVARCDLFAQVEYFSKYTDLDHISPLLEALRDVLPKFDDYQRHTLRHILADALFQSTNYKDQLLLFMREFALFDEAELNAFEAQLTDVALPNPKLTSLSTLKGDVKPTASGNDVAELERQLILCTTTNEVHLILPQVLATNLQKPIWSVNPSWELPMQLRSVLLSLPNRFLQDFGYVLIGKSQELAGKADYVGAMTMLTVLMSELNRPELLEHACYAALKRLVQWESLNLQITQATHEWNNKAFDHESLITQCKECLRSVQHNINSRLDTTPRIEIIENCMTMMLNLGQWDLEFFRDKKRTQIMELALEFSSMFTELERMVSSKREFRIIWDIVLPMFANNQKRPSANNGAVIIISPMIDNILVPFLKKLRNPNVLTMMISLLARIHNILKDDVNTDINTEYICLWPASISNANNCNIRYVSEILQWLLAESLQSYPYNYLWLKTSGDLELALGNNEAAMRHYINAVITNDNNFDDFLVRKMIRSTANLGCYMQSTVLCQLLEETDYTSVIKNLSEKISNCTDGADVYYNCIWDVTLLEYIINTHARRGEHGRKFEAIAVMSTLELNANNSPEVRSAVIAKRKSLFLRALAREYLL